MSSSSVSVNSSPWTSAETQASLSQVVSQVSSLKIHRWSHQGFSQVAVPVPSNHSTNTTKILLKEPPRDSRDNFTNELQTGLVVNSLRNQLPNFVWTYGLWPGPQRAIMLEYIPGVTMAKWLDRHHKHFTTVLTVLIQLITALTEAHDQLGFTHYNLHGGNIIVRSLDNKYLINYPHSQVAVQTRYLPVFIDLGRSYTKTSPGHTLKGEGIKPKSNHFFDLYIMLNSLLYHHFPEELRQILSWYRVEPSLRPRRDFFDLKLSRVKLISPKKFLKKAIKHFGYPGDQVTGPVLTPR